MPYQKLAEVVLAEWRDVERELDAIGHDAASAEELQAKAKALRDEYQHLIAEAVAHHRPAPPPFPETHSPDEKTPPT